MRHANRLCRDNPFMLKVTEGVQEYERFPTKPRAYQPPLSVFVQCEIPAEKPQKNNPSLLFSKPLSIKTASGFTDAEFS